MDHLITEHTTGQLVMPDGTIHTLPTRLLTPVQAKLLRMYLSWAMQCRLEPEFACRTCFDHSRESRAAYNVTDDQITIICECNIRFYQGLTPFTLPAVMGFSTPSEDDEPMGVDLSLQVAELLREYKVQILEALALQEMLRCNACFEARQPDGCDASVTSRSIRIRCRCTLRTFVGVTH